MKKLLSILSIMIMASILLVPNQVVSAKVIVSKPVITGENQVDKGCEKILITDGITHLQNCASTVSYSSDDDSRLEGINTIIYSQNIFSDVNVYILKGNGSWELDAVNVEGGRWAGTFTAYIDNTGEMTVNIRGKGYGTLKGLFLEYVADGIEGEFEVTVTELPSYDGPPP